MKRSKSMLDFRVYTTVTFCPESKRRWWKRWRKIPNTFLKSLAKNVVIW